MINIDTRLLEKINENELWLLSHIVKRMNSDNFCFPSNKTLVEDTGWEIKKLQRMKKSLVDKGLLEVDTRFNSDRQTTNIYKIISDLIGVYVSADRFGGVSQKVTPPLPKTDMTEVSQKGVTEVLSREEVLTSESKDSVPKQPSENKKAKSKKKEVDECYPGFVKIWTEAYPVLGFDALSGRKIKELITKTRTFIKAGGKVDEKQNVEGMFAYVIAYVKREHHWCDGKDISTFTSKYLSIVNEIKSGKHKPYNPQSARGFINSL